MPFKSSLKLDSRFFNPGERKRAFKSVPYASANWFRQNLKKKMEDSIPAGRVESIGENTGFETRFRRSKRGQRPAIQTRNLLNSIYAYRRGDLTASTEVTAEYGGELQTDLGRLVMTAADVDEANQDYIERGKRALLSLL